MYCQIHVPQSQTTMAIGLPARGRQSSWDRASLMIKGGAQQRSGALASL